MAERMEDLEEGEISDSDSNNAPKAPAPAPPHAVNRSTNDKPRKPGVSFDEDDGNSSDEGPIPFKKRARNYKAPTYSDDDDDDDEEEFQNPLQAAKDSGFPVDNFWLQGAYKSTKRDGNSGSRKRVNNIWGSVLQEEELTTGIGGLQNQAKEVDDREMGVESYDWRRSLADTRPYVEPEENSNDADPEPDLEGKESFGTLKTKPRRVKERLGKREDSEHSDESDTETRKSAKTRLGSRTNSRGSEDSNHAKKHRNSPIDPAMDDTSPGKLEHRKLHDRIRQHQSSHDSRDSRRDEPDRHQDSRRRCDSNDRNSRRYDTDRRDSRRYEESRDERRNDKIRQNRKRRAEAKTMNQRNKAIQYVPMKQVDIKVDMDTETIAEKLVESLGEPDDKKIAFTRAINLVGAETVLKIFRATEDVEEMGGLFIQNNARRRTPGGVFFFLMKNDKAFTKEIMEEIFLEERAAWKKQCQERKKEKRQREKERLRKLKEQVEGVNFDAELRSYKDLKEEGPKEQKDNQKNKHDEMEQEETKEEMESEEKRSQNGVADDLFDSYAEEIELDVF